MILKVTCPSCQKAYRLSPPYPPAGKRYRCTCSAVITVSYPPDLRRMVEDEGGSSPSQDAIPSALQGPAQGDRPNPTVTSEVNRLLWTETAEGGGDMARTAEGRSGVASPDADKARAPDAEPQGPSELQATEMMIRVPKRPAAKAEAPREDLARTQAQEPRPDLARTQAQEPRPDLARTQAQERPFDLAQTRSAERPEELLRTQPTQTRIDVPSRTQELLPDETSAVHAPGVAAARAPRADTPRADTPRVAAPRAEGSGAPVGRAPAPPAEPQATPSPRDERPPQAEADEAPAPPAPPVSAGRKWFKRLAIAAVLAAFLGGAALVGLLWYYSQNLPSVESLAEYRPPVVSRVYSADGKLIGEFFEEYRDVVQVPDIPKHVVNAFIAAEDASFFTHSGIDYMGIVRAAIKNVQEGRMAQGASTITQQVAKTFLLTREKSFERKIKEALLANRVEANFPKERILFLYLNQIFLGEGAYGVAAGARIYFDKDIRDVTLAEAAILAGLPQAPSTYNPVRNWPDARERQTYVLGQMVRNDMITEAQMKAALAEDVHLVGRVNRNKGAPASFTEHVRRMLVDAYGHDTVYKGGLTIETTLNVGLQEVAAQAVVDGAERTDQRIGYRGPLEHLESDKIPTFLANQREELRLKAWSELPGGEARNGPPPNVPPALEAGDRVKGVFTEVHDTWALVAIDSERKGWIALGEHTWLYTVNPKRSWKHRAQDDLAAILKVGDVVEFNVTEPKAERLKRLPDALGQRGDFSQLTPLLVFQKPAIEAALFSYRVTDGAVLAMVGGYDFSESEFNRVVQAKRQAGSTFKPFVYAAALDHPEKHYNPSTTLLDAPLTMHKESSDEDNIELWKPGNYGGDYMGEITMRKALILSRNTPTVRILEDIKVPYFYDYVKRLGFDSPLNKDLSMGLGSSSVTLFELSRAYSIFATQGQRVEPRFIDRVLDRDGDVLEDNRQKVTRIESMAPQTAFVIGELLKDVVNQGTGTGARVLGKPVAGKTGTTNDFKDAWFMGFTPQLVTGVWTGYDQPENMGYSQTGGDAAIPIWVDYMRAALKTYDDFSTSTPDKVVFATVDADSGLLATDATERRARVAFIEGTQPKEYARAAGEVGTDDFFMMDAPF